MVQIFAGVTLVLFVFLSFDGVAKNLKFEDSDGKKFVGGERPFDAVNIFGDLGSSIHIPDTWKNKIWWERIIRGKVGKDRFLILCALKDGAGKNWEIFETTLSFRCVKLTECPNCARCLFSW